MSKPLVLEKKGSKWAVFLDVDAAHRFAPSRVHKRLADFPRGTLVPVAKKGDKLGLVVDGKPATFSKKDAEGFAFQIGYYMLDLGQFTHRYVEERRGTSTTTEGTLRDRVRRTRRARR